MNNNRNKTVVITILCLLVSLSAGSAIGQMRVEWERTYENQTNEVIHGADKTDDGGFILAGFRNDEAGNPLNLLRKLNSAGESQWAPAWGDTSGVLRDVIESAEGLLISVGTNSADYGDAEVVCTDLEGNFLWMSQCGGNGRDNATSVLETAGGGLYLAGTSDSDGGDDLDFWLAKLNRDEEPEWQHYYGVEGDNQEEHCYKVIATSDGGLLMVGYARSDLTSGFVVKTNLDGEMIWRQTYQSEGDYGMLLDAVNVEGGGYALIGEGFFDGNFEPWMLMISANGEVVTEQCYPDTFDTYGWGYNIEPIEDGGFFVSWFADASSFLVRTDPQGNELWRMNFNRDSVVVVRDLVVLEDGVLLAGDQTNPRSEICNGWVVRLGPEDAVWGAPPVLEMTEDDTIRVSHDVFDTCNYHHGRTDDLFRYDVTGFGGFLAGQNYQGDIRLSAVQNFFGLDSIQVAVLSIDDGGGDSVWVHCNILPVNDPPGAAALFHPGRGALIRDLDLDFTWFTAEQNPWESDERIRYTLHFKRGDVEKLYADLIDTTIIVPSSELEEAFGSSRLDSALTLQWWIVASDGELETESTSRRNVVLSWLDVGEADPSIPTELAISKIYPNPFNNRATISFDLPAAGRVSLEVFDLSGKRIAEVGTGHYPAGSHCVTWEATGQPAGVYLLKLSDGSAVAKMERMVLLK